MAQSRVVVTGMGIVCPNGNNVQQAWQSVRSGESGIGPITKFDPSNMIIKIAGEVKNFDPVALYGARDARRMDRVSHFALEATRQALEASQFPINDQTREEVAVVIGTGIGGFETVQDSLHVSDTKGPDRMSPVVLPNWLPDGPPAQVSMRYGFEGPHHAIVGACASGNIALGDAFEIVRRGAAIAALAGGVEAALIPMTFGAFYTMGVLSPDNDPPEKACRPFDLTRNGTVISEGSGMLLLENMDHAIARGAPILCEIVGYGASSDAHHIAAPEPSGRISARAMSHAIRDAGISPSEIQYYNAHGTATELNDLAESAAIKLAFGEAAYQLSISSTKSMTGHLLGGASAVEAIFTIMAIQDCFAPPTINLHTPDPRLDLDYVPNVGKRREINAAMSYAAGLGGQNAAIVFKRFTGK